MSSQISENTEGSLSLMTFQNAFDFYNLLICDGFYKFFTLIINALCLTMSKVSKFKLKLQIILQISVYYKV
jgi:hypothetical protein